MEVIVELLFEVFGEFVLHPLWRAGGIAKMACNGISTALPTVTCLPWRLRWCGFLQRAESWP